MSGLGMNTTTAVPKEAMKDYLVEYHGQMISFLCARYAYRAILLGLDDNVMVLGAAHLVESASSADQNQPTTEDALVNRGNSPVLIALGSIELFFQPRWAFADYNAAVLDTLGKSGAKSMRERRCVDKDDPILQEWGVRCGLEVYEKWMNSYVGKKMGVLCSRYNYRGILNRYDGMGIWLNNAMLVEAAGSSDKNKAAFESSIGSSAVISTGAIEMIYRTTWVDAPLPSEEGYTESGDNNNN